MAELVVVIPTRGRPHTVAALCEAFAATCTADVEMVFAVNADDPTLPDYRAALRAATGGPRGASTPPHVDAVRATTMIGALNDAAAHAARTGPAAVGFMNDDHLPRTPGWDGVFLDVLADRPGMVYGDDLVMGEQIPTQWAMSTAVLRALPHMVPPGLWHLYADDYIRRLFLAAGAATYRGDVVMEHMTPLVGKRAEDDGYLRVNAPDWYEHDRAELERHWAEHGEAEVRAVREAVAQIAAAR
jgi:hypothetical protein